MLNLYDDAYLYDLVHGSLAGGENFNFYNKQIEIFGSPVLELACGSGHILIPLAQKGVEIFGLDISDEMLSACRRKAFEQNVEIQIQKGDIRDFELGKKFDLIFIAGNSFQHLNTIREISNCFNCVKRHLKTGGKFIVEVFNPFIPLLMREPEKRFMVGEFEEFVLTEDVNYDAATQINHIRWHFWHRPTDTEKMLSFTMRQFFPQEFDALFEYNDFRIEQKFGDFDGSKFTKNSPKQIVVASPF
jgi:SAM-dependent methyltransferase